VLLSYLPLLRGWQWQAVDVDIPFAIAPGGERTMGEADYDGWFWSAMCAMNNADGEFALGYYDAAGAWRTATLGPKGLYGAGLTSPNPTGIWCSRYDTANSIYVVTYGSYLPLPFQKRYKLSIRAPSGSALTILGYTHLLIEILDPDKFRASLQELLGKVR
jgi:hypothetical protein